MSAIQPGSTINRQNRFAALDGLRAIAALGVLWIHCWSVYEAPRFVVKGFDITSLLALGGNGVDLFFVISGFCMYYFYVRNKTFSYADFAQFIKQRWIRLSPAFYAACLVYIGLKFYRDPSFNIIKSALTSVAYLNGIIYQYTPESILWSLTAEWQFYIIVPFLLIYQHRVGFKISFGVITILMLVLAVGSVLLFRSKSDILTNQIIFRYFQFMWGILVGRLILLFPQYQLKYRPLFFFGFVIITYMGRICISHPVLSLSSQYYNLFKLLGFGLMGLGFGGIVYLAITSQNTIKLLLGNRIISLLGRVSFSFYLWHAVVHAFIGAYLIKRFGSNAGILVPFVNFFVSTAILIPISILSFRLLEKPFMARNNK
nr:acyltransferase [uncultured Mucilaginibacter sp.]